MMSTTRYDTTISLTAPLGLFLLLLISGCGEPPGTSGQTSGPETTTNPGTTGDTTTSGETSPTTSSGTSTGDPTTGDTTIEPTTTGEMTTAEVTATGDTEENSADTDTDTDGGDGLKVGLQAKSLCGRGGSFMCAVDSKDELVCWGKVDSEYFVVPDGKVKSVGYHCQIIVLENGELHRLRDIEAKPVDLPPGPFELAGGIYPYGCAMAADNSMTCWVAEGYEVVEDPPPGPYQSLFDYIEGACQTCGIRPEGTLECWKVPMGWVWEEQCGYDVWMSQAPGHYKSVQAIISTFGVFAINDLGQFVQWGPNGGHLYVYPAFEAGGFVEVAGAIGLRETGKLVYLEKQEGEWVENELVPGLYTTFRGDLMKGCAIRAVDSRVVCWGEDEHGVTDPPQD